MFNVKVKTNGVMIHEAEAGRLRELGVEQMQLSVYSHRPEVHDAITKLPGSLKRTVESIRFLKSQGLKVTISNVMMTVNRADEKGTHALAKRTGRRLHSRSHCNPDDGRRHFEPASARRR